MNRIRKTVFLLAGMAGLCLTNACISVTYEGDETLPPLASDAKVGIYYDPSQIPVPASEYVKVGEVTASGSTTSCTMAQIKARVVQEARARGANGILVLSVDTTQTGEVRSDQIKNQSAPAWTPVDDSASNLTQERNTLLYSGGADPEVPAYRITIKAQLLRMPETAPAKTTTETEQPRK